jgi:Ca2+-transporting ATPase
MTMTFAVMGLGTAFNAVVNRRDPTSGLLPPILRAVGISLVTVALLFLATQLPSLQAGLLTVPLTPHQWLACAGLAALLPIVVEIGKLIRRRRSGRTTTLDPERAVAPSRARSTPRV